MLPRIYSLEVPMGWPSYLEDILSRRDDSGFDPKENMHRRSPKWRTDPLSDCRTDFLKRNAAHAQRYREQRKKTALRRFIRRWLNRLGLFR